MSRRRIVDAKLRENCSPRFLVLTVRSKTFLFIEKRNRRNNKQPREEYKAICMDHCERKQKRTVASPHGNTFSTFYANSLPSVSSLLLLLIEEHRFV
ncbi:hypothetical protein F2P81_008140 [Scophthalmus maximus]|uniref:Uncharacterized protein n=1 Tax=Scophthalmus maximus TaxID=52904 RepID=A0A6A4T451_SCOMX|nr:hypothetical protein F2P81_008140 [Scophthalmus maximus]